ncbi:MAG: polysaccharide biosynthesis protein [Saprospirales bacterium]|nr:polysaccharide biosynthesis protein [Saprospirales bacterium]
MLEVNLSRWSILLLDLGIVISAILAAHLLRFNFEWGSIDYHFIHWGSGMLLGIRLLGFLIFKTYTGIIFHTGLEDAKRIFIALGGGTLVVSLCLNPLGYWITGYFFLPYSVLFIEFFLSIFLMTAYRAFVKVFYQELTYRNQERKRVIIYGAGGGGVMVKQVLDRELGGNYSVGAFVDDDALLHKKRLLGVEIYPYSKLPRLLVTAQADVLIFSTMGIPPQRRQEVVELCLHHGIKVLHVPPVEKWINGELSFRQIREIRIEDLLERNPIQLDEANIGQQLKGKTILVTGAAGSIGSEIARQIIRFHPQKLVLLDQGETPLHELELELKGYFHFQNYEVVLGDVRNTGRMRRIFEYFQPDIVYHAAAYKHVPMMENNPSEALLTNVKGTQVIADLAVEFGLKKVLLVSTDKAANPSSIMGASKRMAEIYIQSLDRQVRQMGGATRFITTRFGNVLGSSGSVIPLFKKQIATGGPVTITHPDMTRFFMTIPEACQLVMEAGAMGQGGEIFVFDMGQSSRILDLARRMIRLSGLEPDRDIPIVYTGLRPGEKLFEEILNNAETTLPTHHSKILIASVREYPFEEVKKRTEQLIELFNTQDNARIVALLKKFIPEYKSNNSVFEELDEQDV